MVLKVAVTGEIRSGKDTVCDYIRNFESEDMQKLYFAEGIEQVIKTYFPEAYEGTTKPRKYFQQVGQLLRSINPMVWVNYTERVYKELLEQGHQSFICTDLRQENEYQWLKDNGFTIIKVDSEPEIRIQRMEEAGDKFDMQDLIHPVELDIKNLDYDYLITNNTTLEDLYKQVDYLVAEERGG